MLKNCQGIVNLSENEYNIKRLSDVRPIASIPIAGRYRIIDFVLSNMVNAGIQNVGIYTDYNYRSLIDHTGNGKAWDLDRKNDGLFVFSPSFNPSATNVPRGDLHHIYSNIDFLRNSKQEYVLVSCSYMIGNVDYREVYAQHIKDKADITIVYKNTDQADKNFEKCYTLNMGPTGKVLSAGINMGHRKDAKISMEMYMMKKELLMDIILESIGKGVHCYLNDAINDSINNLVVMGYEHKGYLKCINSIGAYYDANMDFLDTSIAKEIFYSDRKIFTKIKDESPTFYSKTAKVENSLVANGCIIKGTVRNSILFRRVNVEEGAVIENSIIMQNGNIMANSNLHNVILDKGVTITAHKDLRGDMKAPFIVDKNKTI